LLTSRLFKLGEQFLAVKELLENPIHQKKLRAAYFVHKKDIGFAFKNQTAMFGFQK
jgi:hypothetical protein